MRSSDNSLHRHGYQCSRASGHSVIPPILSSGYFGSQAPDDTDVFSRVWMRGCQIGRKQQMVLASDGMRGFSMSCQLAHPPIFFWRVRAYFPAVSTSCNSDAAPSRCLTSKPCPHSMRREDMVSGLSGFRFWSSGMALPFSRSIPGGKAGRTTDD